MKETVFYNRIYTLLAMLLCFFNLLDKSALHLPPVDYALYACICAVALFQAVSRRHFMIPRGYASIFLIMVAMMALNAFTSKYSPGPLYSAIGGIITCLPFILFMLSYNFSMDDDEIHRYINIFIGILTFYAFVVYVDSFILHTADTRFQSGTLSSGIVFFGLFSSLCNQALVLILAEHYRTHKKIYLVLLVFFVVTIILTNQLKAILGMMLVIMGYVFYLMHLKRWLKIAFSSIVIVGMVAILSVSALFMLKVENYLDSNTMEDSYSKIARPALYYRAFEIASDFFPLGSGQGTYGSVPVNLVGSRIYSDYELDSIWGLGDDEDFSFKMDAHWASILGEMGYIGALVYLLLFFWPARKVSKHLADVEDNTRKYYTYIIRMGIITLFLESIVLALPKNFSFMVIYVGLAGLIFNRKENTPEIQ